MIPGVGNVIRYHHGKLKGQRIFEGTDIQPESFLKLFKAVHQSISVHIKLSGCLGKIQVVFKEALEAEFEETLVQGKNVNIVNSQYASDTTNAMNTAEAILAANPDVKVIFCQSDEMGVAVAQTLESSGIGADDIMVCGLDGSSEAISTIAGGQSTLRSTVFADTTTVGTKVGESICNYLSGGEAEDVVAEYALVNRENASEYITE